MIIQRIRGSLLPGRAVFALASAGLLVLAGCLGEPARRTQGSSPTAVPDGGTETTAPPATQPPELESVLYRLVSAEDRASFAETHGLRVRDDRVLVVVELRAGTSLPAGFDFDVGSRHQTQVQAFVAIDSLVPIAEHENVSFVRSPRAAIPHTTTNQ